MIDHLANRLALRTLAASLSVATTGSATLSATTTGYARASGSFVTDGFVVGMEVTPVGFTELTPCVLTAVSALALTVDGGRAAEASGAGRSLTAGLPSLRAWENVDTPVVQGRWWVDEDYLPGPAGVVTLGPLAEIEGDPMYVLKVYGRAGMGAAALDKTTNALLSLFAPGKALALSTGDVLRVRTNPAPYAGQIVQSQYGPRSTITVPLRIRTANII
jgi:hypothetical protein